MLDGRFDPHVAELFAREQTEGIDDAYDPLIRAWARLRDTWHRFRRSFATGC